MKKLLTTIFAVSTLFIFAQTPQGINYQSVIRNTGGIVLPNTVINMEFKLYNGLAGALVYHESHAPTTNSFGMANLIIGQGSPISGTFSTITWANGIAYEVYVNSVLIGTKQLFMSVPYALHAGSAPAPTVTFTNNILSVGGNTTAISSGVTYTAGNGINITGSVISGTANIIGTGATSVTGIYPNLTINSPTVQTYSAGNGINIDGAGVITNTAPPAPAYTLTTNSNTITINNGTASSSATVPAFSAGNGINIDAAGVITNTASSINLPAAFNGQFLYYNNGASKWDTIPQDRLFYDETNNMFGIGTKTPTSDLHVNGGGRFNSSVTTPQIYTNAIHIAVGTFTNVGDVLTNDGAGNGTWQTPITPTITGTGIAVVTPTTGNVFNVDVPIPVLGYNNGTNVLSLSQGTTVTTATLIGTGSNTVSIVGSGLATVTPTTGSTFTVSVPNPTLSIGSGSISISNGNSVAIPSPSLTINSNSLTINGPGGNTILLPANTISGIGTGVASVTTSANNFTVSVPNPTLSVGGGSISINGGNSVAIPSSSTTLVQGSNVVLNNVGNTYTVSAPDYSISLPGGNTVQITNGPNTSTAAIASTSLTLTGVNNNILSAGGNTVGVNTYTPGTGIAISGIAPNYTIVNTAPAVSPTITGIGMASVTPVGNTFTVSVPSPSYTAGTGVLNFGGTNTVVATPSLSILGNVLRSGPITNTVTLPPTVITGTGTGIATVTTSVNNFTVNVPSPNYIPGTGVLSFGTNTINVSPALSLTGTTLTSGAATNTVNLSAINNWSVTSGVIYPATLTNSVGIGTSGPLTDKMEINHASSTANTHLHLKQTGGDAFSRIKFTNAIAPTKYWLNTVTSAASDANSGHNFFYFNGTTGRNLFTVAGNGKVSVNPFSLSYPTLFEVNGGFELDSTIAVNGLNAMPPASIGGAGKIYFDKLNNKFKVSENGGAYVDLLGGGGPSPWIQSPGRVTLNNLTDSVGIGTAAPTSQLHVYGMADPLQIAVENTGGAFKTGYKIKTATQEWFIGKETGGSSGLRFSDITNGQVRMVLETSGYVGIGTTAPGAKLDVVNSDIISPAGRFDKTDPTNANNTIEVYNGGIGTSIFATNTSSTNAAARFTNSGQGMALSLENTSNTDPTAYILNNGTAPALVVNGKITITDGTQGNGNVLTSDWSGNASWQPVTAPMSAWTYNAGTIFPSNNFSTDKVGIGTNTPAYKLDIADAFSNNGGTAVEILATSASTGGANSAIYSDLLGSSSGNYISGYFRSEALAGATGSPLGVKGLSVGNNLTSATGVSGTAMNGNQNTGVYGSASGGTTNYGVFGEVSGPGYAGYFTGGPTLVDGKFVLWPQAAAPAAFIGQGSFYYDNTSNKIMVAENSTTYKPLFTAQPWVQGVGSVTLANITDNVGIGTSSPTSKLEISGDLELGTGSYSSIKSHNETSQFSLFSSNTAYKGAYLNLNSAGHFDQPGSVFLTHGDYTAIAPASAMHFRYANNGALSTQMSILSSGKIGIGTTTPSAMLHVINTTTTGSSGRFENNSTANTADGVFVTNSGTGAAIHAVSGPTVAGSSNVALWLETGHLKATGATVTTGALNVAGGFIAPGIAPILTNCNDVKGTFSFTTSVTGIAAGAYIELQIIFAKPFITIPTVIATPVTDLQGLNYMVTATTTSSFYVRVYRTSNANITLPTTITNGSMFKFNYMVIE